MSTLNELRSGLMANARRAVAIMALCDSEESARVNLVLPFVAMLGYDLTDPHEVMSSHAADKSAGALVDLAILRGGQPVIAIMVKRVSASLVDERGALAGYFSAIPSVKLGIITNGVVYDFYVDSDAPNMMDAEPFFTLDLETIAVAGLANEDVLETLLSFSRSHIDPAAMAEAAHVKLVKRRLVKAFVEETREPTHDFCRMMLAKAGLKNVAGSMIDRYYAPLILAAFEEAIVLPVARHLGSETGPASRAIAANLHQIGQRVVTAEREIAIHAYVRRRLAFLVADEVHFSAIEQVHYRDFVGRISIYYDTPGKGRLFDFLEGTDGVDKFMFPEPFGEIVTNNIYEIDEALRTVFVNRVAELGAAGLTQRLARIA